MRGNTPHERCCISQFCAQVKIVLINLSTLFSQKQQMTWKMLHHSVLFTIETCIIKLKDSVWLAVKYHPNYIVSVCNLHWMFRSFCSLPQVSWTHVLISNSWQAWLGIVDQNWLKLALANLALGQPISLKVVGIPIPVIITVRLKFPFICM